MGNTPADESELMQINSFYPFGLLHEGGWNGTSNTTALEYGFGGKELNEDLGLNWMDFGGRWYMADLGRWNAVDLLAEQGDSRTPYHYVRNNPLALIDPTGLGEKGAVRPDVAAADSQLEQKRRRKATYDAGENSSGKVIAVFYHGGPTGGGKTTTPEKARTTGEIYNFTAQSAAQANKRFTGRVIAPGATSASGVKNGLGFIKNNYNRGDQVIIYGYSYGVDVATNLSMELDKAGIPVDLLITVDGSDGPLQNVTVDKEISDNVGTNLNIYQTDDSGTSSFSRSTGVSSSGSSGSLSSDSGTLNFPGSNGSPHTAINSNRTHVININVELNINCTNKITVTQSIVYQLFQVFA